MKELVKPKYKVIFSELRFVAQYFLNSIGKNPETTLTAKTELAKS